MFRSSKDLPVWQGNPVPGIYAHVSWGAKRIMRTGPGLPDRCSRPCPHEGLAFAVSITPLAWSIIARIGTNAPVVVLRFDRPALDFYQWLGKRMLEEVREVTDWAVGNRWITRGTDVLVGQLTETEGGEPQKTFSRFPRGGKDHEHYDRQIEAGDAAEEPVVSIEETPGWRFTKKLTDRISEYYVKPRGPCLAAEVFNLWLQDQYPEFGMIWYDETLDPAELSAPRGAILPAYFREVKPLRIGNMAEWCEEY